MKKWIDVFVLPEKYVAPAFQAVNISYFFWTAGIVKPVIGIQIPVSVRILKPAYALFLHQYYERVNTGSFQLVLT
ncbi:MAG: hypothetical protein KAH12_09255, partial [Anaerolineales bacterium]|nr:hypothetical protein [Anaerolineales bacterium]